MQTLLDRGHTTQQANDKEQAVDAYVELLYLVGPEKLPEDVKAYLVDSLDGGRFEDLLDNKQPAER